MDEYGNMLHIQPLIDLQSSSKNGSHLCSTRLLKTVKYQYIINIRHKHDRQNNIGKMLN